MNHTFKNESSLKSVMKFRSKMRKSMSCNNIVHNEKKITLTNKSSSGELSSLSDIDKIKKTFKMKKTQSLDCLDFENCKDVVSNIIKSNIPGIMYDLVKDSKNNVDFTNDFTNDLGKIVMDNLTEDSVIGTFQQLSTTIINHHH